MDTTPLKQQGYRLLAGILFVSSMFLTSSFAQVNAPANQVTAVAETTESTTAEVHDFTLEQACRLEYRRQYQSCVEEGDFDSLTCWYAQFQVAECESNYYCSAEDYTGLQQALLYILVDCVADAPPRERLRYEYICRFRQFSQIAMACEEERNHPGIIEEIERGGCRYEGDSHAAACLEREACHTEDQLCRGYCHTFGRVNEARCLYVDTAPSVDQRICNFKKDACLRQASGYHIQTQCLVDYINCITPPVA
ncbi:MAG: hypothetical protein KDD62_08480 [Bdellovibrionales bacterium]|nr:hypothetical protein [Bdellovibrionales bacterium]